MKSFVDLKKDFLNTFQTLDYSKSKAVKWSDFVFLSAAALKNSVKYVSPSFYSQDIENEYLDIVKKYKKESISKFAELLALFILMADKKEPSDILGDIFMELELSDSWKGQHFTPSSISGLMAEIELSDIKNRLETSKYLSFSDPACGAGSTFLACVKVYISNNINPAKKMFVHGQDIDRTAALMCYIQLSLWNVPAIIVVGDSLKNEIRELWHTPVFAMNPNYFKAFFERKIDTSKFILVGEPY